MSKTKRAKRVKPRREPASVTIGNLELQLRNATARCDDLVKRRDEFHADRNRVQSQLDGVHRELAGERSDHYATRSMLQECQAKLASTEQQFKGYRLAIADQRRIMLGDDPEHV